MVNKNVKISKISVNGLFHTFNHEIRLNNDGVVIVIGENGIGKTTILKIIDSIFSKKFDYLFTIDFDSIELSFSRTKWILYKKDENSIIIKNQTLNEEFEIKPSKDNPSFFYRKFIIQTSENEWFDRRIGRPVSREDIIHRYGIDPLDKSDNHPDWFNNVIADNHVIFVQTQRLYRTDYEKERDGKSLEYMVKTYSDELVKILQDNNALFTAQSIQLDSTFPIRLIKALKSQKPKDTLNNISDIIDEITKLNQYRSLLNSVGIIDKQDDEVINKSFETLSDPNALSILNLYITDNKKKLDIFKDTARKLEILLNIINKRFKYKKLYIDKKEGFIIKSNNSGRKINLINLSSGEQNELIIFYNLLFKTNQNDIVLIDEPEISLHIAWQQRLIDDLKEIAKESGISLVISTHSPDIIGDNWSLVQTLSGEE